MSFAVQVLGNNAAVPIDDRHPSAQVLDIQDHKILIDCGEGTQMRMIEHQIKRSKIDHIFISHLHGDHVYGLPGLITSYNLFGREKPLYLFGPFGLAKYVKTILRVTQIELCYRLEIKEHITETSSLVFENSRFLVRTIPLNHRIPTTGYFFEEKCATRKISAVQIEKYKIPYEAMNDLKAGRDWKDEFGKMIPNEILTLPGKKSRKYAYCADTMYDESIIPIIENADLLFHEATFLHELQEQAVKRKHSTAFEAANIAKRANVKKLILGHFSSRYKDLNPFLLEAQRVFTNTFIGEEGMKFTAD